MATIDTPTGTRPAGEDASSVDALDGRRRILDASAELFVEQGYVGTSLRQIAGAAGIQPASVYHHFRSKEDLFVAVLDDGIEVMVEAFEFAARAVQDEPERHARLLAHVRAHLGAVFEHGPYTTAHVTAFFSAPESIRRRVVPQRDRYEERWQELLAHLAPGLPHDTRRLHRLLLFGAMNTTVDWYDIDGDVSLDEIASTITDQFLIGIEGTSGTA